MSASTPVFRILKQFRVDKIQRELGGGMSTQPITPPSVPVAHQRRPVQRAFNGLALSPLAEIAPAAPQRPPVKRGRPPKSPDGAMSAAERKRLSREKQEWEEKVEELRQEQAIDKATTGRGKGMFLKDAPAGKGQISVCDPEKLALMSDMAQEEIGETGDGKTATPSGQGLSVFERKKNISTKPERFKGVVTDSEKARHHEEKNRHSAESLIRSEHSCKLCSFMSKENRDVFLHVQNEHPGRTFPEMYIVSVHWCGVCLASFGHRVDAVRHASALIGRGSASDPKELKKARRQHRKALKGGK
jgi:hypothetical protein